MIKRRKAMSTTKRIISVFFAAILIISLASCDEISGDLLEELAIYLEGLAEISTVADPNVNSIYTETESGKFSDDVLDRDDVFDRDDEDDDFSEENVDSATTENPYIHYHNVTVLEGIAPTCTEDGLTEGLWCDECGEIFSEQTPIAATGHTLVTWVIDCYADWDTVGSKHADCSVCGKTVTKEMTPSQGLSYASNDDGTLRVTGTGNCTDTDIVIPMTYNGLKVTSIGPGAFSSNHDIKSAVLPTGITQIGSSAFSWAENIEYVHIPETVTEIGDSAFWYCFELTSLYIPKSVTYIGDGAFGCTGMAYSYDLSLESGNSHYAKIEGCLIELSTGILKAGFSDSQIPNNGTVTAIAIEAFAGCSNLKSIYIPEGVKSIGATAFYCCGNLESITFSEGLESIGYNAFNACVSLKSIVLPNSVTEISSAAFTWCSGLESVVIGSGVANIYSGAFNQCSSLKDVFYTGTKAEWEKIGLSDDWDSEAGEYTIHYNYVP